MPNVFKIIGNALNKRKAASQKARSVGLSWTRKKVLKHDRSSSIKHYSLFGRSLSYKSAGDLLHGLEEIFVEECYKIELPEDAYILDCGGNIGLSVIYLSRRFPKATIVTFEPDQVNHELIKSNIGSFGLSNVTLRNEAVWNENTTLKFAGEGGLGSSIASGAAAGTYDVKAARLGPFINRKVDLLKLDIEGAEYEVVKDIEPYLHQIDNIFLEYHSSFEEGYKLPELLDIVQKAGFSFYLREVFAVYPTPFYRERADQKLYDIQLNIYCFRK